MRLVLTWREKVATSRSRTLRVGRDHVPDLLGHSVAPLLPPLLEVGRAPAFPLPEEGVAVSSAEHILLKQTRKLVKYVNKCES